ncbi:MAG: hypothetical protein M1398_08520 [Deltaproteobacteria bacterium]|nr:hypothetical protein [Deltaproteobacteria bacterium]
MAEPLEKQEQPGDGTARKDEEGKIEDRGGEHGGVFSAYRLGALCL